MKNSQRIIELWDRYATIGYERLYLIRNTKDHKKKLGELFLPINGGIYLDAGCGTGNMFELIVQKIQPYEVYAIDWSEKMLEKAKVEAERLQQNFKTKFRCFWGDLSKPPVCLPDEMICPDSFFDGIIANLLISYITCGWRQILNELTRVLKVGGYLYLGTYLEQWDFAAHPLEPWKHAPEAFLLDPIGSFRGLKIKRMIAKITEEAKKRGAEFPTKEELIDHLKSIGFDEMKIIPSHWGGALVLRTSLIAKPPS